jgi:hypothetical protein
MVGSLRERLAAGPAAGECVDPFTDTDAFGGGGSTRPVGMRPAVGDEPRLSE